MPDAVVQRRFLEVLRQVEKNAFTRNQRKVGSLEEIYIRHGNTEDGKAIGETWSGHAVHVNTDAAPEDYVKATIEVRGTPRAIRGRT